MTPEEKDLLLKDLCARLPYGVKCQYSYIQYICIESLIHITKNGICNLNGHIKDICDIKPCLFPMSSMTEEQEKIFLKLESMCILSSTDKIGPKIEFFDWLNRNHFDYRGLIEKGLAIDATNLNIY